MAEVPTTATGSVYPDVAVEPDDEVCGVPPTGSERESIHKRPATEPETTANSSARAQQDVNDIGDSDVGQQWHLCSKS